MFADFPSRSLWKFFSSISLTITLLLLLAAVSVIGTIIPQGESSEIYIREYGESLYRIFSALDFFDLYRSWWFQVLLLALTMNIVVCSVNRLPATWKAVFVKIPPFNVSSFRDLSDKEEFTDDRSPEDLRRLYEPVVSKSFGYNRVEQTEKGFSIFAEKWRWTRLGAYIAHLSIILILVGSLIGSLFGFEGFVNIPVGKTVDSIKIRNTGKIHSLDFEIRCDDFRASFYDCGAPKESRSTLTVLKEGSHVLTKDIIVNHPLRYKGINVFQSSYGILSPREVALSFTNRKTGVEHKKRVAIGEEFDIPEDGGKFVVKGHRASYIFRGYNIGETFFGILTPDDGDPVGIMLPLDWPLLDKMRGGTHIISVADHDRHYFAGLLVTSDPGYRVVYAGFILMIVGFVVVFFMSHQRLCIEVSKEGNGSRVMVAGTANKNRLGMQNRIKRLSQRLMNL